MADPEPGWLRREIERGTARWQQLPPGARRVWVGAPDSPRRGAVMNEGAEKSDDHETDEETT